MFHFLKSKNTIFETHLIYSEHFELIFSFTLTYSVYLNHCYTLLERKHWNKWQYIQDFHMMGVPYDHAYENVSLVNVKSNKV